MNGINTTEFITELIFCLNQEDVVKAKALLQFASDTDMDVDIQRRSMIELGKGPERVVLPLLEYLTQIEISNPKIQEYLYELILDKSYGNTDLVIQYITKSEKKARLLFIDAAGDLLLTDTTPFLERIISRDNDMDIISRAVTSLGKLRQEESMPVFSGMANRQENAIKRKAIVALSNYCSDGAVDHLMKFIGTDEETSKFAIAALADIQTYHSLDKLTTLLRSDITMVRDTAIDQLMRLGNKATPILTKAFQNAEADYLVHLITTLGYIGDPAAITPVLDIINTQPGDTNIRQAAYEVLERIPSPKTAICLVQGLQDPVETVRMSAARAIDNNLSKMLVAGLRNVVREESNDSQNAVAALIDAESANIFNFLVEEESFLKTAGTHMVTKADPVTRSTFLKQMTLLGQKEFINEITEKLKDLKDVVETETHIFVVDDSKMMLRLYYNKLAALGLEPATFNRPEEALPLILEEKPDLVITDLNMPNISGLELTREIRKKYSKQDLPILMITTQSDFVEEKGGDIRIDDYLLAQSGINKILHKPFNDQDFNSAIQGFIDP